MYAGLRLKLAVAWRARHNNFVYTKGSRMKQWLLKMGMVIVCVLPLSAQAQDADGFANWLVDFQAQAVNKGISPSVAQEALSGIELDDSVIQLDGKQPEKKITLTKYLSNTINARRIRTGRAMMEEHRETLQKISARYHVQPEYIVALWGIESDYGAYQGDFSVVQSLATLAYEGRRREFFSDELLAALNILMNENMSSDQLTGSWAGAMGNCQFMPSTYLSYAVDGDGDGKRDIWSSVPDTLASIANYLHSLGWQNDRGWGVKFEAPEGFVHNDIKHAQLSGEWRKQGLRWEKNASIPGHSIPLYAIHTGDAAEGTYLITDNYKAILQWNRSRYFATAVGTLADAIRD